MREIQEVTHARVEPRIAGCPGLFLPRAARRRGQCEVQDALDARYTLGEVELRVLAPHRPRPTDLMLMAAILALAGPGRIAPGPASSGLIDALECEPRESAAGAVLLRTTYSRLLKECGRKDGGKSRAEMIESLIRLAALTAIVTRGRQKVSMHLLSFSLDEESGEISLALSPRLSAAILGGRHTRLVLAELRVLGEHARILYVRLCTWIDPGRARRIGIDVLCEYLWPQRARREWETRDRRRLVRRAMASLARLRGWRVRADARGEQYTISRPADGDGETPTNLGETPTREGAISV